MDVGLSDLLICPRCGPTYGLVLLPYEAADRRVTSGVLGCANCRERWEIAAGVADLRVEGEDVPGGGVASGRMSVGSEVAGEDGEAPVRLAGLMGLGDASGTVLVAGPAAAHAEAVSALVEGVEVVAVAGSADAPSSPGVSRMRVGSVLPFRTGSLRGVALTGPWAGLVEEGARVVGRAGRLVLDPAPRDAAPRLSDSGLEVLVEEAGAVVAARRS